MLRQCAVLLTLAVTVKAQMESFIVGSTTADITKFPHVAFLTIYCVDPHATTNIWICGSSLLNQKLLLTAAHCVWNCYKGSTIIVNMGNENRNKGLMRSSKKYIAHERYDQETMSFDIALVKLSKAVKFNDRVKRVAIMKNPPITETAYIAGWGLVQENTFNSSIILKQVDQKLLPIQYCRELLELMPRGTFCARSETPNFFPAQGDSGSGLIVRDYIAIGVVSFKVPTKAVNVLAYTDVGHFYDWLMYQAKLLYCKI